MFHELPRSESRAEARRRQILEAAEACFCARGFHAATMAEIAGAAGLSVGQIYRFFENKEAVIEAIADLQMEELLRTVGEGEAREGASGAIRVLVERGFQKLLRPGMAALMLEITAEASRNPRVAAVVREHDSRIRHAIRELIAKAQGVEPDAGTDCRAELMCLIFEGAAARLIRNPDFGEAGLRNLQADVVDKLLAANPEAACGR